MENENTPPAQEQQAPAEGQVNEDKYAGLQKRFDEFAAKNGNLERQLHESLETNKQLMAMLAAAPRPAPVQEPVVEVDPEARKTVETVLGQTMGKQFKALMDEVRELRRTVTGQSFEQIGSKVQAPPEVLERARQVMEIEAKNGNNVSAEVAIDYAWGQIARETHGKTVAAKTQRQAFNGATPVMTLGGGAPDISPASNALPADFDARPFDEQLAILRARGGDKLS